jgi:hypothetical protein
MIRKRLLLCMPVVMLLGGCSGWHRLSPTEQGAVIGGGSGAAIGAIASDSIGGTLIGGGLGAVGGGLLGHMIGEDERHHYRRR